MDDQEEPQSVIAQEIDSVIRQAKEALEVANDPVEPMTRRVEIMSLALQRVIDFWEGEGS